MAEPVVFLNRALAHMELTVFPFFFVFYLCSSLFFLVSSSEFECPLKVVDIPRNPQLDFFSWFFRCFCWCWFGDEHWVVFGDIFSMYQLGHFGCT